MSKRNNTFNKEAQDIIEKAKEVGFLGDFDVRNFLSEIVISEGGYVMDTGSRSDVNAIIVLRLAERIKEHPILWKLFFMIA